MLIRIPAVVTGSRADAVFHSQVPPQETATPSTAMPVRNTTVSRRLTAGPLVWLRRVAGSRVARVTTSVARPTTLDQEAAGIAGRVARNVALARPYQVHSATAPTAAARPRSLTPRGAAAAGCVPANAAALTSARPARLRATGTASRRQGSAGVRQLLATAMATGMDPMIVSVMGAPIFWMP